LLSSSIAADQGAPFSPRDQEKEESFSAVLVEKGRGIIRNIEEVKLNITVGSKVKISNRNLQDQPFKDAKRYPGSFCRRFAAITLTVEL